MAHRFSLKNISLSQIISIILIILALLFITQNFQNTEITIVIWRFQVPLFVLLAVTFMIGFYTAVVFGKDRVSPTDQETTKK